MKNWLLLLSLVFIPFIGLHASYYDVELGGICYSLNKTTNEAIVVNGTGEYVDGIHWKRYSGDIVIPETIMHDNVTYKVTAIEGGHKDRSYTPKFIQGFEDSEITSITLPNSITKIEPYTFRGCSSLQSVVFGNAVTSIGEGAFSGCGFQTFTIPEGVESLEYATFSDCKSLVALYIPKSLKKNNGVAVSGCEQLKEIHISDITAWCNIEFGGNHGSDNYFLLGYAKHLYYGEEEIEDLVIPETVTTIKDGVFQGCGIKSLTIGNNVQSVGYNAFWGCENLKSIILPNRETAYYPGSFYDCPNLEKVICYAETPPSGSFFKEGQCQEVSLFVPTRTRGLYIEQKPWNEFKQILPIDGLYLLNYIVDGKDYKSYEIKEGSDITPEAIPVKDGHEFSGWSEIPVKMPSDDVTVTGKFKYNIKYMVDGTEYKTVGVFFGDAITPEEDPTKKGYTFSGWSVIPETMPAEDIVITGTFDGTELIKDKVKYKVTDNENNYCKVIGNDNASGEIKIDSMEIDGCYYQPTEIGGKAFYGCKDITKLEIPATVVTIGERAFANIDKLTDVTCWAEVVPTTDRTTFENSYQDYATLHVVYAAVGKYKEVGPWKDFKEVVAIDGTQRTFVLTYKVDGEVYKTVEIKEGEPITPEAAPTKEGYTFSGWSEIPEIMPSNDLTITGTFTINKYKLVYMVDNEEYKSYEIEYNAAITPETAPTKEGYTFSGWSEIPERMPAKDVTVTGTFAINKYKLVYQVDGADYKTYEIEYNADITPEPAPTKTGYTFSGWSEIPAKMPAKDVTVTGTFAINKYKLIYQVDGAEYKSIELEYNATITPEPAPTKEGYTFSGWSEIPEKMPDHDVTVTGTFAVNKYQLIYKVDGEVYKSYEIEYGAAITPEAAPTKEGYTFSGWSEIPATMPAHDVTITGTFTKGAYKLTYMIDGEVYKTFTYDFGAAITPEPDPTREGYTFSGWSYIPSTMPAEDVTVTGSFVANKYQLTYMVDGEVYKTYEVAYGTEIEPEPAPTKDGWTFSGWSWIPKKMPAEDVTITGTFTQNQYEAEGGTYVITEDGVTVIKGEDKEGEVTIQTTITINGNTYYVTVIGEAAFKGCTKMSALVIPDGIKAIGTSAFEGCSHLRNINIGKGITAIDHKAFANIGTASVASTRSADEDGLKVSCSAETVPTADTDVFENADVTNATLMVNDDLVNAYKTTSPWSQFGNIVGFNEASGIDAILTDQQGAVIYSIDGRRLDNAHKGMNIIRTSDGHTRKVVLR